MGLLYLLSVSIVHQALIYNRDQNGKLCLGDLVRQTPQLFLWANNEKLIIDINGDLNR
jgi:hypothetical protein